MNEPIDIDIIDESLVGKDLFKQLCCIAAFSSRITNSSFLGCKFDRGSRFRKCDVKSVNFAESILNGSFDDTEFTGCDFTKIKFRGGLREFGFKFCIFNECDFNKSVFKGVYFINCQFNRCKFEFSLVENCLVKCCEFNGSEMVEFQELKNCEVFPKSFYK